MYRKFPKYEGLFADIGQDIEIADYSEWFAGRRITNAIVSFVNNGGIRITLKLALSDASEVTLSLLESDVTVMRKVKNA